MMWQPYLKVIARRASGAVHVLDHFHMSKAIDEVRAKQAKRLKAAGYEPVLHGHTVLPAQASGEPQRETGGQAG